MRKRKSPSKETREKIAKSLKIIHLPIHKHCLNCKKEFFRHRYSNGIEEPFPRYKNRKYCSLYCARHSREMRKILTDNAGKGSANPNWRGGKMVRPDGYVYIYSPHHPYSNRGYVMEHRLVMEKFLKRFLLPKEVVHHINEVKDDNRIENLMLFKNTGFHLTYHLT
jgi:hypothetical protein